MIAAGVDIKTIQTRLGHSTPAITMALYVHPEETRDRAAANALAARLERLTSMAQEWHKFLKAILPSSGSDWPQGGVLRHARY